MGEIVNFNKARKAADRAAKTKAATVNRSRFGLSKLAKVLADKQQQIDSRRLDGAKRDPDPK